MAIGDAGDMLARLGLTLPPWFSDAPPHLQGVLAGMAAEHVNLWDTIGYARQQTRLATLADGWADAAAWDFFGSRVLRGVGESDAALQLRLRREILQPRATRASLIARLTDLGCTSITVFEPARPADIGGYGIAMGYGVAGAYGSLSLPNQSFITLTRPAGQGIPNIPGYSTTGGYRIATAYARLSDEAPHVTDQDIYDAIVDTIPVGSIGWIRLSGAFASAANLTLVDSDGNPLTDTSDNPLRQS